MTRMWMIKPCFLCRSHLLGEHNEIHKIIGSLKRKRSISGYIKNNYIEPKSIKRRHKELVREMKKRGYNHNSKLPKFSIKYLPKQEREYKVDILASIIDLKKRCNICFLANI